MEKYRRVPAPKEDVPDDGVVRIQVHGKIVNYVSYACGRLEDDSKAHVQLVGRGRAINKVVTVAEVIRRKLHDVHQLTALSSVSVTDRYEPLEDGLEPIEQQRTVSCITIDLARGASHGLDESLPGYSPPLTADEAHMATDAACASMDRGEARGSASNSARGRTRGGRSNDGDDAGNNKSTGKTHMGGNGNGEGKSHPTRKAADDQNV